MEHTFTGDIGGSLRRARELKGLSLADAVRRTKLPPHVIEAIERNDFESLPPGMYRKAYVRTLASEAGLNPNELVEAYCEQFEPRVEIPVVPEPDAALQEKWLRQLTPRPQRSMLTLAAVTAPAVAWFMLQSGPAEGKAPLDYAVSEPAAIMSPYASVAFTADSDPVTTTTAGAARATASPIQIEMTATDSCWVAADTDGERVMYRLVQPGERVVLAAQHRMVVRLGNAGSMAVSINGAPSRSFGVEGQIVNLDITPENVHTILARADEKLSLN